MSSCWGLGTFLLLNYLRGADLLTLCLDMSESRKQVVIN